MGVLLFLAFLLGLDNVFISILRHFAISSPGIWAERFFNIIILIYALAITLFLVKRLPLRGNAVGERTSSKRIQLTKRFGLGVYWFVISAFIAFAVYFMAR